MVSYAGADATESRRPRTPRESRRHSVVVIEKAHHRNRPGAAYMAINDIPRTIWWEDDKVRMVDQSRLPLVGDVLECDTYSGVCVAIKSMAVRGAPALGVAAALAVAAWARNESAEYNTPELFFAGLEDVVQEIKEARPTAVHLQWGAERLRRLAYADDTLPLDEI
ncbi:hypothetical protein EG835_08515, partial [bacterium]|nr:hypothetical protein [bacterium]